MAYWRKLDTVEQILIEHGKLDPWNTFEEWACHLINTQGVTMTELHRCMTDMLHEVRPEMSVPTQNTVYNYLGRKGYKIQSVIIPFGHQVQIWDKIDA